MVRFGHAALTRLGMHVAFGVFAGVFLQVRRKTSPTRGAEDKISVAANRGPRFLLRETALLLKQKVANHATN